MSVLKWLKGIVTDKPGARVVQAQGNRSRSLVGIWGNNVPGAH